MPQYFPWPGAPRSASLVTPAWVHAVQEFEAGRTSQPPPTYDGGPLIVLEVSWAPLQRATEYLAGHLPGVVHLDTDILEDGYPTWKLRPINELHQVIGSLGIAPGATVVVYGHRFIAAARAWWALMYAGVSDVRLMDGGFAAWESGSLPVETEPAIPVPVPFAAPPREHFLATTAHVLEHLHLGDTWLADVRSAAEFAGERSGYDYLEARGRIPGAIHCGDADDASTLYVTADGHLHPAREVLEMWRAAGIAPATVDGRFEREVIVSCGSGWRSSAAFFHAWLLGFSNIRNYSDGWCGWSTDYVPDASASGATPGWRQDPSGRPIAR